MATDGQSRVPFKKTKYLNDTALTKRSCKLSLCQMFCNASMWAEAEAQTIFGEFSMHIKLVRVWKNVLVPVGGQIGSNDALACSNSSLTHTSRQPLQG